MADNSPEKLRDSREQQPEIKRSDLERAKTPEKVVSKSEIAKKESDLAERGEKAEKKLAAEKEKRELDLSKDKERVKRESTAETKQRDAASYTKAEKKAVYKKELKNVRAQLPPGSRAFSKVVHNPVVERVSDATAKTVFRPSALIGGAVMGLILGLIVYIAARYYGYVIPNMTLVLLLIIGAIVGVLVEFIITRFHKRSEA